MKLTLIYLLSIAGYVSLMKWVELSDIIVEIDFSRIQTFIAIISVYFIIKAIEDRD